MLQELQVFWENHHENLFDIGIKIAASLIIIIAGVFLSKAFNRLVRKKSGGKLSVDDTASAILRSVVRYGIFIICLIMVLNIFGVNTASLIAILGAAGIAVGLALKDTLGNIAAGVILFFMGSYRYGEFIEFGSFSGTVKDINLFSTILETPDGVYISAPNSSIWGSPLRNFTRNGKRRMELPVRVSYLDSIDSVFAVLQNIISSESRFLNAPPPQIIVQSMQDCHVVVVIRAWASIQDFWDVHWYQMRNIRERIEEAGFKIPFPQQDVHLIQDLNVNAGN